MSESAPAGPAALRQNSQFQSHISKVLLRTHVWAALYLDALDEVSHWEVVEEEDADQHLHHFAVELERELMSQDQLETQKNTINLMGY